MSRENILPLFPANAQHNEISNLIHSYVHQIKTLPPHEVGLLTYCVSAGFSGFSGILYWFSSTGAVKRYQKYLQNASDVQKALIEYVPRIGGSLTNVFFNFESYLTIYDQIKSSNNLSQDIEPSSKKNEKYLWLASFSIAFFTVLPLWYLGVKDASSMILPTIGAGLNWPVYADGTKSLISYVSGYHFNNFFNLFTNAIIAEKRIALKNIKNRIVSRFYQQIEAFAELETSARDQTLMGVIGDENNTHDWTHIFSLLLTQSFSNARDLEQSTPDYFGRTWCSFLTAAGLILNFGLVVESYNGGRKLLDSFEFGCLCALLTAMPTLGFSMKGFLKLNDIRDRIHRGAKTLESTIHPLKYTLLSSISLVFALFSGFTVDEAGYESWMQVFQGFGGELAGFISGVIHNIGGALSFNLPQCLFFSQRCVETHIKTQKNNFESKRQILFNECLKNLTQIFEKMSLEQCHDFFNHMNSPRDAFFTFLWDEHNKGKLSEQDISTLGEFYTNKLSEQKTLSLV